MHQDDQIEHCPQVCVTCKGCRITGRVMRQLHDPVTRVLRELHITGWRHIMGVDLCPKCAKEVER